MSKTIFLRVLLALVCSCAPALGAASSVVVYDFDGRRVEFVRREHDTLLIARSCERLGGKLDCDASRALERAKHTKRKASTDGRNPGSVLCRELAGRVELGHDDSRGENSFSVFGDDSAVSCDSLAYQVPAVVK